MNTVTAKIMKRLALLVVICLAFVCYAMSNASGMVILIVVGFILEGAFWLFGARLFNRKKSSQQESSS
ncbi:hypothetical protein [Pseudoalteromonas sp. SG44-8]|uniref:hypothetical protein n=1 Tax=Pseudoalteromonas sp. SG44-8 TaxID=2760958 RepID=UPI0016048196|nr:hypothetical protein [Pseudoalteromonas sp. SG44-8]MBB1397105.1 hypothetical protein [Pseudoalteromonas sp. SG44-8]